MSELDFIAAPMPLPHKVVLTDPGINNGEPFEYGPNQNGVEFRIRSIDEEISGPGYYEFEYDAISNLPKVLPKYVYFYDGQTMFMEDHDDLEERRLNLKKFRAYIEHIVNTMGELCMVFQFTPDYLLCAENIPFVVMCAEDLNCDGESFSFNDSMMYRFVSREKAPFPLFHGNIRSVPSGCVTLLACSQKLPEGYAKEYGLDYSDNGVSSRFFNQFELDMNKEFGGLKKGCQYFLGGLHNLYTILPPNLYISSLNPSFYPYGNKYDRMKRKEAVKKIVDYLQSIVDKQGDVWYIREWVPDKIALADSVEIRTIKVSDLDISGDEFEFELCVLYHFVN